ncbi:c-type cytochrome biogenesis protein CcsB [Microbacterium imperiale]|uniref:C-type cytochrome biogenesis protein CcsB n=1 Tax=Microbacterium imperiale TaxID=33884 RepID=A0A9W6HI36_9MICO|nr:c-type cytochrome biogenesis protein CcsB [Microbacterium imperiale]MBP2421709.1 cytochrome c-type biogenesis protein CcsB [Microbacterium imperiale]MDS0199189.1 c-type cytochrome biogenesis protein CcsB [Microbacterium imperiale]BFE42051.1 c-type cytochrome biogenesis protein CcsB [Microbacterium imperiale]GLJ81004.1 c-type cytochrome biogenesis protein CcsB [Microbacterium imperiale]
MPEDLSLDAVSVLLVWTAVAVYALAFIAYAVDLARRSDLALKAKDAAPATVAAPALVGAGAPTIREIRAAEAEAELALNARPAERPRLLWARIGTTLTWLGFLLHVAATVLRGIAAERVPWSNMYEFAMTGTVLVVAVYLVVLFRYDLRFLGTFITGLVVVLLGGAATSFYVVVVPLADPLKSVWLVIHVFVASLASAFLALAFALSVVQLMQARREARAIARVGAEAGEAASASRRGEGARFLRTLPSADALESLAYRFAIIGFIFWTFTLIAGAIWANDAWGRYWGFDTKEVWTFVIWVLYAGYIHARATRGWRGNRSAWLSIVGFSAVLFNFIIVNQFFKGLHAYSGLS